MTITAVDPAHDWSAALRKAVAAVATGYDTPPVPRFAANVGRAGLTKLRRLLTDERDAKGWPTVFGSDRRAAIGLSRLHDGIEWAYTAPTAGRPLEAAFLREAAAVAEEPSWREAADRVDRSAEAWSAMAGVSAAAHPNLGRYAELSAARAAEPDAARMRAMADEQRRLVDECDLPAASARDVVAAVAGHLEEVIGHESAALELLTGR